jgi:mono/diheme cytochrome c family protein
MLPANAPAAAIIWAASVSELGAKPRVQKWTWVIVAGCGVGMLAGSPVSSRLSALQTSASPAQAGPALNREFLTRNCVACHNQRLQTAGLALDNADVSQIGADAGKWEKVVRKVRTGSMPPAGRPRPDAAEAVAFVTSLESALDRAAASSPNPGRPAVHRLNRAEYANAIRDLLGVEVDVRTLLPADDADEHGFDNIADVLSVSPALLDRYMSAAKKVTRQALGRPLPGPAIQTYNIPRLLVQNARLSEDLPFGSRGGIAVRHAFPVDGEYSIKIKLQTNLYDYIRGVGRAHRLEVRLDGARVAQFVVGGEDHGSAAPASFAGAIFGNPAWEKYAHDADANLEGRFTAKAGTRLVGVTFVDEPSAAPEGVLQPRQVSYPLAIDEMRLGDAAVENVAIGGPYAGGTASDTPSRRRILTCTPASNANGQECARSITSTLARRAYRRPVTTADVDALLAFYEAGRRDEPQGGPGLSAVEGFEAGIQRALERLLVDPEFLFRVEHDPAGAAPRSASRVSDLELASRLSFFLWSSIPDDELLDLAGRKRLSEPGILQQQTRRLFDDPRGRRALVENFAGQWLELRNIREHTPDPDIFDEFDENLRDAMRRETELFIDSQLTADRSVVELLNADYTFINERLARHYGIPGVYGERFRRVSLGPSQDHRRGLLGQASLLTVTSYPNRTSPVLRGKWVLGNLLGAPPPPPPPDVNTTLTDKDESGKFVSVRARLEQHRRNPACSSCHATMDPLGFALENFDPMGRWRATAEGDSAIDASGALVDGSRFEGPAGLRSILLARRQQFISTVAEKLLSYALGRRLEAFDQPAVRKIVRDAAADDYRWSSLVRGVVASVPFQMRRSQS